MENWVARTKDGRFIRFDAKPIYNEALNVWTAPNGTPYSLDYENEYPYPPISFEESPMRIIFSYFPYFHFVGYSA